MGILSKSFIRVNYISANYSQSLVNISENQCELLPQTAPFHVSELEISYNHSGSGQFISLPAIIHKL